MAERSKAAVLKTVDVKASWGSNPYLSANASVSLRTLDLRFFCLHIANKFVILY